MKSSFYIAASSASISRVQHLATLLEEHGHNWYAGWDWTKNEESSWEVGKRCLEGAFYAHYFILLLDTLVLSKGAHVELGARLSRGRSELLYIVGASDYLFYLAPWIKHFATDGEMMRHICGF
jgi:hypothetical protein